MYRALLALAVLLCQACVPAKQQPQDAPDHRLGGQGWTPTPPSWANTQWVIDPANVSGCASDSNTGTTATCGAEGGVVGPLLTWRELNANRWGCRGSPGGCPALAQNTTITWLSSHVDDSDPVIQTPALLNGANLINQGLLNTTTLLAAGVFGTVTPVDRNGGHPWRVVLPVTGQINYMLQNTSRGNSIALVQNVVSGATVDITQPLTAATIPAQSSGHPTPVTTWTTGDSVSIYKLPEIAFAKLAPTVSRSDPNSQDLSAIYRYHLGVFSAGSDTAYDFVELGPWAHSVESTCHRYAWQAASLQAFTLVWNSLFHVFRVSNNNEDPRIQFLGGGTEEVPGGLGNSLNAMAIDYGAIFTGGGTIGSLVGMGDVCIRTGIIDVHGFLRLGAVADGIYTVPPTVYGNSYLNLVYGTVVYPQGAGAAAGAFLNAINAGLQILGTSTAYAVTGNVLANYPLTPANLDNAAKFKGLAVSGACAFTNGVQP